MNKQAKQLLSEIGSGRLTPSAYDTAWVARLTHQMPELAKEALGWLRAAQLNDGSWGAHQFFNTHDRIVCTLAATLALQEAGDSRDTQSIEKAHRFLSANRHKISLSPIGATVGFEMIVPTLVQELNKRNSNNAFSNQKKLTKATARQRKLKNIPSGMVTRNTTMAYSAEMFGIDNLHPINWEQLPEANGSVGFSPAATAYFVKQNPEHKQAQAHLNAIFEDGQVPNVSTIDLFEVIWSVWNFQQAFPNLDSALIEKHLDFIESSWVSGLGTSFAHGYTPKDGDDSSLAFEVLVRGGRTPDLAAILGYEEETVFRCFQNESDPSISTNIHVIGALKQAGYAHDHPSVQKALQYLRSAQHPDGFWLDKWHTSPYYPSSHYVLTVAGYAENYYTKQVVNWIITEQNRDGSWGHIIPTAEETAYSLMALAHAKRVGCSIPQATLQQGKVWLEEHQEDIDTPLWIGKCLYSPVRVISSTILSALVMVDNC